MKLYLAWYILYKYPYMEDTQQEDMMDIVHAENKQQVQEKIAAHWVAKDSEYSLTYSVDVYDVREAIN